MRAKAARPGTAGRRPVFAVVAGAAALGLVGAPAEAAAPLRHPSLAVAPVSVSLSAPASVSKGNEAVFGVAVTAADTHLAVAGGTVVLDRRDAGRKGWREADRSVTDTHGHAVFAVHVRASQDFRARALENDVFAAGRSGVLRVRVKD